MKTATRNLIYSCLSLGLMNSGIPKILAQGCSDAGVCTSGGLKAGFNEDKKGIYWGVGASAAVGERLTFIGQIPLDVRWVFSPKFTLQLKSSYQLVFGDLGSTRGFTDPIISLSSTLWANEEEDLNSFKLNGILGYKMPINSANKSIESNGVRYVLPMPYQTSLGTHDIIGGLSFIAEATQISVAAQVPIDQNNKNEFNFNNWTAYPNTEYVAYFQSSFLNRAPDLFARYDRIISTKSGMFTYGGMLIYHLQNDQLADSTGNGGVYEYRDIEGSKGATINLNVQYTKYIPESNDRWELGLAFPILVRESRPDGLTRAFVLSFSYIFSAKQSLRKSKLITPSF